MSSDKPGISSRPKIIANRLVVRHGPKAYNNGKSPDGKYQLDPPLKENCRELTYRYFINLLQTFKPPVQIVTSPFLRARETADAMRLAVLHVCGSNVPVIVEPLIGEFLSNQALPQAGDLREGTGPVYYESSFEEMKRMRIPMIKKKIASYPKGTWMVSHGVIIETWWKCKYPKFLGGIAVTSKGEVMNLSLE